MIHSLFIAIIPSVQYFGQQLLFRHEYCCVVSIHGHVYWNLKREVPQRTKSSRLWLFFDDVPEKIACSRPSTIWTPGTGYREERNGFMKADVEQVIINFTLFCRILWLKPYPSMTTVYAQSAFCTRTAFYSQSGVCILPLVCSLQSSVCLLH